MMVAMVGFAPRASRKCWAAVAGRPPYRTVIRV